MRLIYGTFLIKPRLIYYLFATLYLYIYLNICDVGAESGLYGKIEWLSMDNG